MLACGPVVWTSAWKVYQALSSNLLVPETFHVPHAVPPPLPSMAKNSCLGWPAPLCERKPKDVAEGMKVAELPGESRVMVLSPSANQPHESVWLAPSQRPSAV